MGEEENNDTGLKKAAMKLDLRECHLLREAGELLRVHCASAQKKELEFEFNWKPSEVKVVQIDRLGQADKQAITT